MPQLLRSCSYKSGLLTMALPQAFNLPMHTQSDCWSIQWIHESIPDPKVISTAGLPRPQGLVEWQNRTLLTLLRVICSSCMWDSDQHLDKVMGAYRSTRHTTTGFSPNMLTRGTEKAITAHLFVSGIRQPIFRVARSLSGSYFCPRAKNPWFGTAQHSPRPAAPEIKVRPDNPCNQKETPKLMRAWRGPHKVAQLLQEGRVCILDTGKRITSNGWSHTMVNQRNGSQCLQTMVM